MVKDNLKIFDSLRTLNKKYKDPGELIYKIESMAKNLGDPYSNHISEYISMIKQELNLKLTEKEEKYIGILDRNKDYTKERVNEVGEIWEKIVGEIEKWQ